MNIRKAQKKQAKIKMALQGPSGSGKTFSSLRIAHGLTEWEKICIIDTENNSADLYAELGPYNVLQLSRPFTPEKYIMALEECESRGIEVIIIDSLSHEWDGEGGVLEIHSSMAGNTFLNWSKVTPRHNALVQRILNSEAHIITTFRTKQDYVLTDKNGKMVPEKVGLKSITRDGMDYEFTIVLDLDIAHHAVASKDRTGLFINKPPIIISEESGQRIFNWCNDGVVNTQTLINQCSNSQELKELYTQLEPGERNRFHSAFLNKQLEFKSNFNNNGVTNHKS